MAAYFMDADSNCGAWLESPDGRRYAIRGSCSIGRSKDNQVVLSDGKVSRRHAMVQAQGESEYWLVDFGSANGSFLNNRRVSHPTALQDRDEIGIAESLFVFHRAVGGSAPLDTSTPLEVTIKDIKSVPCWLLVVDIESFTRLSQALPQEEVPVVVGRWLSQCKQVIDAQGGMINKFLGDGFFAYWKEKEGTVRSVAQAIDALEKLQALEQPRFRVVIHHGMISVGGASSMGEESLLGKEVNFVFRMEKLAGTLKASLLFSEAAAAQLGPLRTSVEIGQYPVSGFDGQFSFYEPPRRS